MVDTRGRTGHSWRNTATTDALERRSIWVKAYEALRTQILTGELAPGTRLNLRDVAEQLHISVTPARDAALQLAAEGLVEVGNSRSLRVTQLTEKDVVQTLELRVLLEAHSLRQGGPKITEEHLLHLRRLLAEEETIVQAPGPADLRGYATVSQFFHHALVASADNRILLDLYERLHAYVVMERAQQGFLLDRIHEDHQEHVAIVGALQRRAPEEAAMLLMEHLEKVQSFTFSVYHRTSRKNDGVAAPQAAKSPS